MKVLIAALMLILLPQATYASQGAATFGCDNKYPKIRVAFQKLFDSGKYRDAYSKLQEFVDYCDGIKDKRMYWIWSDLSLVAYKMKDTKRCLDTIQAAEEFLRSNGPGNYGGDKKLVAKMTPSPVALRAIANTKKLCQKLKKDSHEAMRWLHTVTTCGPTYSFAALKAFN